ncbi:MAG: glycosyltransferase [Flavobacteriales bacterium]|nr:glycosyltransferase [Flavobacteriales bacterium]
MADSAPLITVVIPTFRRWDRLQLTLEALSIQVLDTSLFEVVVSDDGSGDDTLANLEAYAKRTAMQLRVVTGTNAGPSAARNRGIAAARGTWVAMTDDDCVPDPAWLRELLSHIEAHPNAGAIGGKVERYRDTCISRYVDWTRVMLPPVGRDGKVVYLVTANAIVRADHLQRVRGFDETYKWPGGEDPDLSYRLVATGVELAYAPKAVVKHMHRETVRGTYRMFWHHGLGLGAQGIPHAAARTWGRTLSQRLLPGMRRAFRERSGLDAWVFAFLEAVRHYAFHRGMLAYRTVLRRGGTSAN